MHDLGVATQGSPEGKKKRQRNQPGKDAQGEERPEERKEKEGNGRTSDGRPEDDWIYKRTRWQSNDTEELFEKKEYDSHDRNYLTRKNTLQQPEQTNPGTKAVKDCVKPKRLRFKVNIKAKQGKRNKKKRREKTKAVLVCLFRLTVERKLIVERIF